MDSDTLEVAENVPESEIERLTWALVDEQITDEEHQKLERLLLDDADARAVYCQCIQMHADLHDIFSSEAGSAGPTEASSPVLGFLHKGPAPLDFAPPEAEGTAR